MRRIATGRRHSEETKEKLSKHFKGCKISPETKKKISETLRAKFVKNPDNVLRRKNRGVLSRTIEYRLWRRKVFERDNFKCVICGDFEVNRLTVDHKKPLCKYPELALDVENGRTLCARCHVKLETNGKGAWNG
ncbi:MAG: HNH endonuclease [Candidatus Marinimicrobia bacterium]|nr:HNH endonuclease [Candidatus Neomarinimicrobiota bacterium]